MTIYKLIDEDILVLCANYISGRISVGQFQSDLLDNIRKIVSIEDKKTRDQLFDLEAELDGNLALYYGSDGVNNLNNLFFNKDDLLREITFNTIYKIRNLLKHKEI